MDTMYNKNLIPLAKSLRKNMTNEEKHLWYDFLRKYEPKFTRQKVLGKYIADFYCGELKLIIELDGSQHYTEKGHQNDAERTAYLEKYGITVLRFSNIDVNNNFEGVCRRIETITNNLEAKQH